MVICKNCGASLKDGAKFCTICGAQQVMPGDIQGASGLSGVSSVQDVSNGTVRDNAAEIGNHVESGAAPLGTQQSGMWMGGATAAASQGQPQAGESTQQPQGHPQMNGPVQQPQGQSWSGASTAASQLHNQANPGTMNHQAGQSSSSFDEEPRADSRYAPVGTGGFMGYMLLFGIPVIGWIIAICVACGARKVNAKNYAKAFLFWLLLGIVLSVLVVFLLLLVFRGAWDRIEDIFRYAF